jgi:hypothetical protein
MEHPHVVLGRTILRQFLDRYGTLTPIGPPNHFRYKLPDQRGGAEPRPLTYLFSMVWDPHIQEFRWPVNWDEESASSVPRSPVAHCYFDATSNQYCSKSAQGEWVDFDAHTVHAN